VNKDCHHKDNCPRNSPFSIHQTAPLYSIDGECIYAGNQEIIKPPEAHQASWRLHRGIFSKPLFINYSKRLEFGLEGFFLEILWFGKNLVILLENVNKNCQLPLERLYERRILENHYSRK